MAKQKKKRNKRYTGEDAATNRPTQPTVHRITAADRSALGQWWFEKKRTIKITSIIVGAILLITWLIIELVRIISG